MQNLIDFRIKEKEIEKYNSIELDNVDISRKLQSISGGNIALIKEKFLQNNISYEIFERVKITNSWQNLILMLFQDKVKINENEILLELTNLKI